MERQHLRGLTLVELLAALCVLAILLSLGIPAMAGFVHKNRLRAAAEELAATLHYARSEALSRPQQGQKVYISFQRDEDDAGAWCYGLRRTPGCDCRITDPTVADACRFDARGGSRLYVVHSSAYPGVAMEDLAFGGDQEALFDAVRGTARSGHVSFDVGAELRVILSSLGRVRLCSPDATRLPGYTPC